MTPPRIAITFCTQCQWRLRAAWMAQELLQTFGANLGEVALLPASNGRFEITYDGRDHLSEILTDQDVATLTHLARHGIGPDSLRALAPDLADLDIWAPASTGSTRSPLKGC
ncbi:SelT/SelW/SelH family protein [Terripilifer ovatus]|uniref:SelT/SelW/SelH family protein n=1 Tax=Terripilifer ovatus TaxID=3032367 RepID=UPI003AB9A640